MKLFQPRSLNRPGWIFFVVIAVWLTSWDAGGEQFQVRNWCVEDGLLDSTVTAVAQTPDGCLWVGTPKGLVRFDGVSFTRVGDTGGAAVSHSWVVSLLVDRQGSLWILTRSGAVSEFSQGKFHLRYSELKEDLSGTNNAVADESGAGLPLSPGRLALDANDAVWAMLDNGSVLKFEGPDSPASPDSSHLPKGAPQWMVSDGTGQIWVAKGGNISVFQNDEWAAVPAKGELLSNWTMACTARRSGIWVAAAEGSWLSSSWVRRRTFDGWDGAPLAAPPAPESARSRISAVLEDRQGRLWVGMFWSGVFVRDRSGRWERVQLRGSLAQCVVTCLFEDHDGAIWAGTIGEGVHQILPKLASMTMLPPDAGDAIVNTAFASGDSSLWMGTDGSGIFHWEPGRFTRFGLAEGLPHAHVCAILQDANSNLWVGTWAGLARQQGGRFVSVAGPPELREPILALFSDAAGNLWTGGNGGVCVLQGGTNWMAIPPAAGLTNLDVRCITEDAMSNIWVAAMGDGLLEVRDGRLTRANAQIGLRRRDVRCVLSDADGVLWIGTLHGGLYRFAAGHLQHYGMADGLPDDSIISLITDHQGNLWMSSNDGIFGCSRERLANYVHGESPALLCWHLTPASGLSNRGCSGSGQPVASATPDGRLWFADMRGVADFNSAVVTRGGSHPDVFVDYLTADGTRLHPTGGVMRAPASTRRFEFHYTAPDLSAPQTLRFRYRLEPLDHNWMDAGALRVASYSQLRPGTYRFRVMEGGADGRWHQAAKAVRLVVVPHFWQTLWFRAGALTALMLGLATGVTLNERRKLRRRLERMESQQILEAERRRIARDLHDDLGAGLAEVVLLGELAKQGSVGSHELPDHVTSMTDKTRALVAAMDEIVWTVNPRNDSVRSLVFYLSEHLCRFLSPARIRSRVSIPDDLPATPVSAQVRHNVFLAVKEALHNVSKHSGATEVWFRVECADGQLVLLVEDNGRGFDPATANGDRNGLDNMRSRLQALGGSVRFESRPDDGTTVVFKVPLPDKIVVK